MSGVTIYSDPYPGCRTEIEISSVSGTGGTVIVCINTGSARLQTYATRDELRHLGEILLRHANANEVLEVAA